MATYLGTDTNNPIEKQQCPKLGCAQWGCKEVAGFKKCLQDRIKKIWWLIGCGDLLETEIKVTPKFLALGGGAFTQGRSKFQTGLSLRHK